VTVRRSQPTPLARRIAARIVEHIREDRAVQGARLVERALAERLNVSRSPVRAALRLLAEEGVVTAAEGGGYRVLLTGSDLDPYGELAQEPPDVDDHVYYRLAADRLDGRLPDKVTENALSRRYKLTPAQLGRVLRRVSAEGWIERLPGYGWEFQPMLTSLETYQDSYRFRRLIEPAAILEPGFTLDRAAVERARGSQQRLIDGAIWTIDAADLFDLNSAFHETIMECSGNTLLVDALRRVNRLRRLIEYRRSLQRDRALVRCREHVEIADLLLAGRTADAAEGLRRHLDTVAAETLIDPGGAITT
jgi:DNA-binding GntR family transcriptional regulator